jgi:tungstate transport system permease protein
MAIRWVSGMACLAGSLVETLENCPWMVRRLHMSFFWDSFQSALILLWARDPELMRIVGLSLQVSISSTLLAGFLGVPLGFLIGFNDFRLKRAAITILNTLLALPTVVIGLFVYSLISRRGPLGMLDLLYTPTAMVIGQVFLILPVITAFTVAALSRIDSRYRRTALTLGAGPFRTAMVVFREARFGIVAAVVAAFGRVISEIGISMMLGGNARGFTRTMTTAMALEYDKGEFVLAVALGIVLLTISLVMNVLLNYFQGKTSP